MAHTELTPARLTAHAFEALKIGFCISLVLAVALFVAASAGSDTAMVLFFSLASPQHNPFAFFLPLDLGGVSWGLEKGIGAVAVLFMAVVSPAIFLWRAAFGE